MIRLKLWRLQSDMTQLEAAQKIGIGESSYASLESGRVHPSAGQRRHLSAYFGDLTDSLFQPVGERVDVAS